MEGNKMELQVYAFVLRPGDMLKLAMADEEKLLRWDDVKGFVGVVNLGIFCSYHLYLTPEGCKKGAEIARRNGLDPLIMDESLPLPEKVLRKFSEVGHGENA